LHTPALPLVISVYLVFAECMTFREGFYIHRLDLFAFNVLLLTASRSQLKF